MANPRSKRNPFAIARSRIRAAHRNHSVELDLSGLGLDHLPPEIVKLTWLRKLDLTQNKLRTLPDEMARLAKLERLLLGRNLLREFPKPIAKLVYLVDLIGFDNELLSLPEWIGNLQRLQVLGVSDNNITSIPSEIRHLQNLRSLYLRENHIRSISKALCELRNLRELRLSGNSLTTLPSTIGGLRGLNELWLGNNQLESLPKELLALRGLRVLYLHGNDRLGLGESILGPTPVDVMGQKARPADPRSILDYYFRVIKTGRPLNEVKIILVGRGQAGKTSVVRRLVSNKFNPREKETPGISITPWQSACNKSTVRFHLWDFAGQEMTHATHQFFFTDRSIYILVLTGREDSQERDADYWMRLITSFGGDSPVLVLLNKYRLHPFAVDENVLRERYPSIRAFISTDCKTNSGFAALRKEIASTVAAMDSVRTPFPGEWFSIKDALAAMKENYLSYTSYEDLCKQYGEQDPQAQARLASFLHALGIALNYGDDPRLRHTTILNPRWVTNGIYAILRAKLKGRTAGELYLSDLATILPREDPKMREYLVELMRRFELCFPLGNANDRYLVPQRLDPRQPTLSSEWADGDATLRLRYEYSVLPEGVIPRFIVRTYALSENLPRWRHGVILAFEKSMALVRGDALRGDKVEVIVRGQGKSAQRLAAIIRENFSRIHSDLKELNPKESVELTGQEGLFMDVAALTNTEVSSPRTAIPTATGDVAVDKTQELNRLTPRRARKARPSPIRVFVSYAHFDETWKDAFVLHLDILRNEKLIREWNDRRIIAGQNWDKEIRRELEDADIVIFLVSTPFLASGYIQGVEVRLALTREKAGKAVVVPIILKDCAWKEQPWKKNQVLPKDGKPITHWGRRDEAWHDVERGIRRTVAALRRKPAKAEAESTSE